MIERNIRDGVALLKLAHGDKNEFGPSFLREVQTHLNQLERDDSCRAVVVTGKPANTFSVGMDLQWASQADATAQFAFYQQTLELLRSTLIFPKPTIASINGHCFGLGALWGCAFDFRLMREDRGWYCFPGIDVGVAFPPVMLALIREKIAPPHSHQLLFTGARVPGPQAVEIGLATSAHPGDELLDHSLALAKRLAQKDPSTYRKLKQTMFGSLAEQFVQAARQPDPIFSHLSSSSD